MVIYRVPCWVSAFLCHVKYSHTFKELTIHFRHVLTFLTHWAVLHTCVYYRSELVVFFCQHVLRLLFAGVQCVIFLCHCQVSPALCHILANCPASYRLDDVDSGSQTSGLSLSVSIVGLSMWKSLWWGLAGLEVCWFPVIVKYRHTWIKFLPHVVSKLT